MVLDAARAYLIKTTVTLEFVRCDDQVFHLIFTKAFAFGVELPDYLTDLAH